MSRARTIVAGTAFLIFLCLAAFLCSAAGAAGPGRAPAADDPISVALLGSAG